MLRGRANALLIGAAAGIMALGGSFCAFADTVISDIRITFRDCYDTEAGAVLEPSVTGGEGYQVDGLAWSAEPGTWQPGQAVTAKVTLSPETGYSFADMGALPPEAVSGARLEEARRETDGRVTVEASYVPVVQLGKTKHAGWSDDAKTMAVWDSVPYATAYQIRLYRGEGEYVTTLTMGGTSVDLSHYMPGQASYYFEVRATSQNSADAAFRRNGEYVASKAVLVESGGKQAAGRWFRRNDGYCYMDESGAAVSDGWRYIQGIWYYFDHDGFAVTGWRQINGKWYYMDSERRMQTGWLELDGKRYFADSTGAVAVGWYQASPAEWYYFYEDGSMASDVVIDGYQLGADGKRQ